MHGTKQFGRLTTHLARAYTPPRLPAFLLARCFVRSVGTAPPKHNAQVQHRTVSVPRPHHLNLWPSCATCNLRDLAPARTNCMAPVLGHAQALEASPISPMPCHSTVQCISCRRECVSACASLPSASRRKWGRVGGPSNQALRVFTFVHPPSHFRAAPFLRVSPS